jgi:hypothetical protein
MSLVKEIMRELLPEEETDPLQQQPPQQYAQQQQQYPSQQQQQYVPQPPQQQYAQPPQQQPYQQQQYAPQQQQPYAQPPQQQPYAPPPQQQPYAPPPQQQPYAPPPQQQPYAPPPQQQPYVQPPQQQPYQQPPAQPQQPKVYSAPKSPSAPVNNDSLTPSAQTTVSAVSVEVDQSLKPVEAAFFYPEGKEQELVKVKEKFKDVIKKHNLKFRLESVFDRNYNHHNPKINFSMFVELCKNNKTAIMIVVGPPQDTVVHNEDFINTLGVLAENEQIALQFIPAADLNKDYRYLNLALDITLIKHKNSLQSK